jgi:hypothetical protein
VVDRLSAHARASCQGRGPLAVGTGVLQDRQVFGAQVVALLGERDVNAVAHLLPEHAHHRRDRLAAGRS